MGQMLWLYERYIYIYIYIDLVLSAEGRPVIQVPHPWMKKMMQREDDDNSWRRPQFIQLFLCGQQQVRVRSCLRGETSSLRLFFFFSPLERWTLLVFFSMSCRSVLVALISGEAMEVACSAFFSAAAVVPAELQALHDASPIRAVLKEH
jgi:hypothetical protein